MERIKTGIKGLDELLQGGIPKGSCVLVSGGSGTGKSILCMQFLVNGATSAAKEPGIFVTAEANSINFGWDMDGFNWNIRALQDKNLLRIYKINLPKVNFRNEYNDQIIEKEFEAISKIAEEIGAKRIAVDSTTPIAHKLGGDGPARRAIFGFADDLKELGCTTLMTSEVNGPKTNFSAFGIEEFVSDGLIVLYFTPPNRSIFIRKMRGTNHSKNVHPLEITKKGIEINQKDLVLWESVE